MPERRIFDITRPVRDGIPVWPGDAPYRLEWTLRRGEGGSVNLSELRMSAHTGSHADAPYHTSDEGARVGEAPLDVYLGPAILAELGGREEIDERWVEGALAGAGRVQRLLVRTGAWTDPEVFPRRFPALTAAAAARLAEAGVRLFGTDAPSVDPFDSTGLPAHRALREGGVAILEGLLLDGVPQGEYELIALPLRLEEADGSPVRAVLRRPEGL